MDENYTYDLDHGEGLLDADHFDYEREVKMNEAVHKLTQDILVACILLGLIGLVGVLGNLLMLRALVRYKDLRIDFYILLGSVSAADILCLIIAVPRHIIHLTEAESPVTDSWCNASKYIETGAGFVASYHLVILAVLRGIVLTSRGRNPPTPLQTLLCVAALWLLAMLGAIPFAMTMEEFYGMCRHTADTDLEKDIWMTHAFSCFVPVGIFAFVYLLAHYMSKRYFEDSYSYREKQISRLVTAIVVVFIICQFPFRILDLHIYYREMKMMAESFPVSEEPHPIESLYIARNYLLCLMMADKAARPVIYSKLAPDHLAEAFDEVINCTMCHRYYTRGRNPVSRPSPPGHNGRLPSTASNAPLTGTSDEIKQDPEISAL